MSVQIIVALVALSCFTVEARKECRHSKDGVDYRGEKAVTANGRTCQRWDSQSPHAHTRNDVNQFSLAKYNEENYCRNPDDSSQPWCYTTDPNKRWEICSVPKCPEREECYSSSDGVDYRGVKATTVSGRTCQRWDSQSPHGHTRNNALSFPDAKYNEENYCRNPDHEREPWCYTTDSNKRWEFCGVNKCTDKEECFENGDGDDYRGVRAITVSGRTCQKWNSQSPHKHTRDNVSQFPDAKYNEENYCRNPDHDPAAGEPWCYTTDPDKRWEVCGIAKCEARECRLTKDGGDYRGKKAVTTNGRKCQRWDSQSPHEHTRNDVNKFARAKYNEENYCRNPDHEREPWCYTTDPNKRWEFCSVPKCPGRKECYSSNDGVDYRGVKATTVSGRTCQRWDSQSPHGHTRNSALLFPDAKYNEENYCRNPDHSVAPWCYTTDSNKRWEVCGIHKCTDAEECFKYGDGGDYRGVRATTVSGRTCQKWNSQSPHKHTRDNISQFPDAVYNEENYCRNPDHDPAAGEPWCYTTDPDKRWEVCGIAKCPERRECYDSIDGDDYRGVKATTVSGKTCQRWDSQSPHKHTRNDVFGFPDAAYNEENYCRNPDHDPAAGEPWCYTMDSSKRWEVCGVPKCSDEVPY